MNTSKRQQNNRHRVESFFKLGLTIILIALVCITGCEKLDENSGKLEALGKSYLLDTFTYEWENDFFDNYVAILTFASSDDRISFRVCLHNLYPWDKNLPTGTFKMEEDKEIIIANIRVHCDGNLLIGSWSDDSSATLKIKKSKNSYSFTLKGVLAGRKIEDVKLTFTYNLKD